MWYMYIMVNVCMLVCRYPHSDRTTVGSNPHPLETYALKTFFVT
jgi:hypothetical protein